jgi:hypothetical protein
MDAKLRQKDAGDLSIDEEADLMLKSKAHQMTEAATKGSVHTEAKSSTHDEQGYDTEKPKDVAFVGQPSKDTGDAILKDLMDSDESEHAVHADPEECSEQEAQKELPEVPNSDAVKLFEEAAEDEEIKANAPQEPKAKKAEGNPVDDKLLDPSVTLRLLEEHADESAVEKALKTGEDNEENED